LEADKIMGNQIRNDKADKKVFLKLSNGATDVLLSVLILSGADLAVTQWEKELMVWLAAHDQSVFGSGTVGFDIDEIAWTRENFYEQQAFLLTTIDLAITRHRWNSLSYDPPFAQEQLKNLRIIVKNYLFEYVEAARLWDWRVELDSFSKCPVHKVYLHEQGCLICHDEGLDS